MPRLINRNPRLCLHRSSGQAYVTIAGQEIYLGPHGSKAARDEYDRIIGQWLANGRRLAGPAGASSDLAVTELVARYWAHAQAYHKSPSGHGGELGSIKLALGILRRLYGPTPAAGFGPVALGTVRAAMVKAGWCRSYVNAQVGRLRRVFKWAVANELVPEGAWRSLQSLDGLRAGKTDARESAPVRPVPEGRVEATVRFVSRQVRAMIELQALTGMRPGEVVTMRGRELERADGAPWVYRPEHHKTKHHGHAREIYLGPRAVEVLAPFLKAGPDAYLFSPADAESERLAARHRERVEGGTPLSCGNVPGSNRARKRARAPRDRYDVDTYRRAIERACDQAFPLPADLARLKVGGAKGERWETAKEWRDRVGAKGWAAVVAWRADVRWHPHQLRHLVATRLRKAYGIEAARVVLGHATLSATAIYAEKNVEAARRIMGEVG